MAVVSGGTTLIDNGALDAAVPTGSLILLSTQTASSSASIEFTSGIDSTYSSYIFKFYNIHPSLNAFFTFNMSIDGGSNYNVTKTTTYFRAYHNESGADSSLGYVASFDLAQSTSDQTIASLKTTSDCNTSGTLQLYNPSSDTFVKHFMINANNNNDPYSEQYFVAGYGNTTNAINAVIFRMSSGNIDDGIIKMYGVS